MNIFSRTLIFAQLSFILLWSSGFVGVKYGLAYVEPFTFLFLRYALLALILLCFTLALHGAQTISWSQLRQIALIGTLAHALYLSAVSVAFLLGATAGTAALIGALQPLITGLVAQRSLDEHTEPQQWLGLIIGFLAVVLIAVNGMVIGGGVVANVLLFVSLGCITVASLHQRWLDTQSPRKPIPLTMNFALQCTISAILLSIPALLLEGGVVVWNTEFIAVLLWMAFAVSLGGFGTMWFLVQRCPATQVASLTYATVPVTMIFGYFVFNEKLSLIDAAGLLLATTGIRLALGRRRENGTDQNEKRLTVN